MGLKENIKSKREELHLTLEDVAKIAGTSRQTIQRYESGTISNVPSDKIELIAKALHTTPAYLMGWEQKEEPANKDELDNELLSMVKSLSPEKRKQAVDFLRFLKGTQDNQK